MKKIETITFLQLFNNFTTAWGNDRNTVFFDIVFALSKKVNSQEVFTACRNEIIDFSSKDYEKMINKYFKKKMPLAHVVGSSPFMGLRFQISRKTLAPRDVTQAMVKEFIKRHQTDTYHKVLDLCCGSGCIGVSIKRYCQQFDVVCIDKYWGALFDTNANAIANHTRMVIDNDDAIKYLNKQMSLDILISNPPYVNPKNFKKDNMFRWENKHALVAKEDGLYFIKRYVGYLATHNFNEAWIEFGYDQFQAVKDIVGAKPNLLLEIPEGQQFMILKKKY